MPQTSPMNWIILSFSMILSILYIFNYSNEKILQKVPKSSMINLTNLSWNW